MRPSTGREADLTIEPIVVRAAGRCAVKLTVFSFACKLKTKQDFHLSARLPWWPVLVPFW